MLPTTEREVRHGNGNGDVHPDHARLDIHHKLAGSAPIVGEDRGAVSIHTRVDQGNALFIGLNPNNGQHRSENFVLVDS